METIPIESGDHIGFSRGDVFDLKGGFESLREDGYRIAAQDVFYDYENVSASRVFIHHPEREEQYMMYLNEDGNDRVVMDVVSLSVDEFDRELLKLGKEDETIRGSDQPLEDSDPKYMVGLENGFTVRAKNPEDAQRRAIAHLANMIEGNPESLEFKTLEELDPGDEFSESSPDISPDL